MQKTDSIILGTDTHTVEAYHLLYFAVCWRWIHVRGTNVMFNFPRLTKRLW